VILAVALALTVESLETEAVSGKGNTEFSVASLSGDFMKTCSRILNAHCFKLVVVKNTMHAD